MRQTHGYSPSGKRTPEYVAWCGIKNRCLNSKYRQFKYYGGRGIKFHKRWHYFENFIADVGDRPSPAHSIDRYPDNDGDYRPGNVRWATVEQQHLNTRKTRYVRYKGNRLPLFTVIKLLGLSEGMIRSRLRYGWSPERAISDPPKWRRPDLAGTTFTRKKK